MRDREKGRNHTVLTINGTCPACIIYFITIFQCPPTLSTGRGEGISTSKFKNLTRVTDHQSLIQPILSLLIHMGPTPRSLRTLHIMAAPIAWSCASMTHITKSQPFNPQCWIWGRDLTDTLDFPKIWIFHNSPLQRSLFPTSNYSQETISP